MTNKEKFTEIFGIEPDCGRCNPYPCEENDCKYWEQCENQPGCPCDNWWDWEFEEPATKNNLEGDCISRTQAQTEIEMNASRYTIARERGGMGQVEWSDQLIKVSDAVDIIRDLPSVTPQPRKGHWIKIGDRGFGWSDTVICKCSECEHQEEFMGKFDGHNLIVDTERSYNFCPNCGAKMVEPQESEE